MNFKANGPRSVATGTAPIESLCDQHTGAVLKSKALTGLAARNAAIIRAGQRALLEILLDNATATVDDVRDRVSLPEGMNPKVFGSVPGALAKLEIITDTGFVKSRRPKSHARPVKVWQLIDRDAAHRWLDENPLIRATTTQATLWGGP